MQDRLSELMVDIPRGEDEEEVEVVSDKGKGKGRKSSDASDHEEAGNDGAGENSEFMAEFFEEVAQIKQGMSTIRRNIRQIEESYSQSLVAVGLDQGQKQSDELERLIDATNLAATDVRNRLKDLDTENKELGSGKAKGSAEYRIRTNMHGTLTRKFLELMTEYQEVQTKYKNKFRERVERQYKIVKPDATQDEIDEVLESGDTQVFAAQILDKRHSQAKEALAYIENKHRDILRLEQSIKELHQLFLDMAILVEAQGEMIDQIEFNVSQSVAYVKGAVKELGQAKKYQKRSRKKLMIIGCLVCCILVVVLVVGLGVGIGKK